MQYARNKVDRGGEVMYVRFSSTFMESQGKEQ